MEYDIAQGKTRKLIVEQVNKAIQEGWKPIGGVMYDFEDTVTSTSGSERTIGPSKYSSSTGPVPTVLRAILPFEMQYITKQ